MKGTDESLVWHLHRALLWIPSLATLAPLPQSCSTPQACHYSLPCPNIGDTVTHPQNWVFRPFCRGHPNDNTHLSHLVTLLERLQLIWLEASSEFSSITEKLDLSASTFLNVNGAKPKINQTSNVLKNNVLKNIFLDATLWITKQLKEFKVVALVYFLFSEIFHLFSLSFQH